MEIHTMTSKKGILIATLLVLGIINAGLYAVGPLLLDQKNISTHRQQAEAADMMSDEPILPIPLVAEVDKSVAALGKKLFHDPRLSADNSIACASCHSLSTAGVDGKRVSTGINGQQGSVNAPTVFNSGFNTRQFWDGRAATLEEQVSGPIANPREMATDWPAVIAKLKQDADYTKEFGALFTDGITSDNIARAIAEFERSLITPNARFDKFLRGDGSAITREEKTGFQLFKTYGCSTCHQGAAVGGNMFERLGTVHNYFDDHKSTGPEDDGRFNITQDETHRHYFKVPSLRNVEKTAPYFHNGAAVTLHDAVRDMAYYNLGVVIPDADADLIVKFLKTLTGEYEGSPL